jgi:hypothetical protein
VVLPQETEVAHFTPFKRVTFDISCNIHANDDAGRTFLKSSDESDTKKGTAFGSDSDEVVAATQTAIAAGTSYSALSGVILTHPTASESLTHRFGTIPAAPAATGATGRLETGDRADGPGVEK